MNNKGMRMGVLSFVVFAVLASRVRADVTEGLEAHWKLDEGCCVTACDATLNGHTGQLTNGPTWSAGVAGGALLFDGVDDYVVAPHDGALNPAELTISVWFKADDINADQTIVNKQLGYWLRLFSNRLYFYIWDGSGWQGRSFGSGVEAGVWHHVAATYAPGTLTVFMDGEEQSFSPYTLTTTASFDAYPLFIGSYAGTTRYFGGAIDDVRVYTQALDAAEIGEVHASTSPPPPDPLTGLEAHWKVDEGSGVTAGDATLNGHTGQLTNGPTWSAGVAGGALLFDGMNDYVVAPHDVALNPAELTISVWFKANDINADQTIVNKQLGYWLRLFSNRLYFYIWDGSAWKGRSFGSGVEAGVWHHVAATYAPGALTVFMDGVEQSFSPYTLTTTASFDAYPLFIGSYTGTTRYFDGAIDDVRVYARALDAAEIGLVLASATAPPPNTPTGLEAIAMVNTPQVNLRWGASGEPEQILGYKIYRNGTFLAQTTVTSYQDKSVSAGTSYSYKVSAQGILVESAQSEAAPVQTHAAYAPPAPPDYFPMGVYAYLNKAHFDHSIGEEGFTAEMGPHADAMQAAGVNLLIAASVQQASHIQKVVDIFSPRGIAVVPFGATTFLSERDIASDAFADEYASKLPTIESNLTPWIDDTRVAGWYPVEEYRSDGIEAVRQFASAFQAVDPSHPIIVEHNNFDAFAAESPAVADILVVGTYPFRYLFGSIASLTTPNDNMEYYTTHRLIPFIEELNNKSVKPTLWGLFQATPVKKTLSSCSTQVTAVMSVLTQQEMFDQGWTYDAQTDTWSMWSRYVPTEGGTRGQMWLATALGVKGLVSWEYAGYYNTSTGTYRSHWTEFADTIAEINPFTPTLLNLEMQDTDTATSPDSLVFMRSHRDALNDLDFVIVVNQRIAEDIAAPQSTLSVDANGFLSGYTLATSRSDITLDPAGADSFFDLHTLTQVPGAAGANVDVTLEPGQGKIYLVGDQADFARYQSLY